MKTDQIQKVHKDWYKLDLSAIVYPTLQRRDFSSVYRLSVLLKEDIDPEILQRAAFIMQVTCSALICNIFAILYIF